MSVKLTIAVASGKGGTGKTTISASLALAAAESLYKITYLDCDVEEPNGHLFLEPRIVSRHLVGVPVPVIDEERCISCGACGEFCQYNAIVCIDKNILVFDKMCHGCGGCMLACPASAISEKEREIGVIEKGSARRVDFFHGKLNVGEAMSPPLIKAVRSTGQNSGLNIIDAPPGTSCPVIASIKGVDFVLLVTEPTPFGINDLGLAVDMVKELGIPHAVVVNKHDPGYTTAHDFCRDRNIKILAEIPNDRKIAEAYSIGKLPHSAVPGYRRLFKKLLLSAVKEARL